MSERDKALAVRKRLFDDFEFWAANCWHIRTKSAKIVTLTLNRAQKRLLECCYDQLERRGYVRLVILKGRQMGASTFVEAFLYWWTSQRPAQKALVVAHDKEATKVLFTMTQRGHEKMPEALKPSTTRSSTTEIVFDKLDSAYRIVTAGGDGIVRGDTITANHMSEGAWWPKSTARANYSGLMDAMPAGRFAVGTLGFNESTANSFNMFFEHCDAARTGESDWGFVFLPWWWDEGCEAEPAPGFERSPAEAELAEMVLREFGDVLTDSHLQYRRIKIAEKGEDLFRQEYPSTPDEAFLTSGSPVFNAEALRESLEKKTQPIARMRMLPSGKWVPDRFGELLCYLPHDENETYYIGGDVGFGVGKDASVLQVLDSERRQAAVWRSARMSAAPFGVVAASLGRYYNEAKLTIERNGPGLLTNHILSDDERYPNVWMETQYDKISDVETPVVGLLTTVKTKPMVVEELRDHIALRSIEIYDETTLQELLRYIVSDSGRYEAEVGHHDDAVIALALASHSNEGKWVPIVNQADWYLKLE